MQVHPQISFPETSEQNQKKTPEANQFTLPQMIKAEETDDVEDLEFYDVDEMPDHEDEDLANSLPDGVSRDDFGPEDDSSGSEQPSAAHSRDLAFAASSKTSKANADPKEFPELSFIVTNLDTKEKYHVDEIDQHMNLTLDTFVEARENWSADVQESQRNADAEEKVPQSEEHIKKKESAGWFEFLGSRKKSVDPTEDNGVKVRIRKKKTSEFSPLRLVQQLFLESGPIWTMKFSPDANYLAAAGSDAVIRIWTVSGSPADIAFIEKLAREGTAAGDLKEPLESSDIPEKLGGRDIINKRVFKEFTGHSSDVVDLSWSNANFLLTASLDKTVRLWHVSKDTCLCKFQHADFVTSVVFHPTHVKLFLSGSYDKILRVWNILDHRVENWAQADAVVTSAAFSGDGRLAVAGLSSGQCIFYRSEGLSYVTQIDCRNRHGKFSGGKKVTGLRFLPDSSNLLVTTCDSRIRLYDMDDKSMRTKFKGLKNERLPIRAEFSEDHRYVICGSEEGDVYIWNAFKNNMEPKSSKFRQGKTDRNATSEHFEGLSLLNASLIF